MSARERDRLSDGRRKSDGPKRGRSQRLGWGGWLRRLAAGLFFLLVVFPLLLTLIYAVLPPPGTPLMVIRLFQGEGLEKSWVPIEEVSRYAAQAVIASEDNRFCEHGGFDWTELENALEDYRDGKRLRGASTVSMQTAKNLFLWNGRNYLRKGLEAYLTTYLELLWSKRRIMEVYLNIVEWGPGVYGIEAAARHHFKKGAKDLTRREAALLAAILPNPRQRSAARPSGAVASQARRVEVRIRQLGPMLDCVAPDKE